jgi:hypothetical protein
VLFVTDGDAQDQSRVRQVILEAAREPVFFVFVGVGNQKFGFLKELDATPPRPCSEARSSGRAGS